MPESLYMPDVVVEIAFDSLPDAATFLWTDVSAYVEAANPITITRGRSDELTEVQPSRLTVTLDNKDGRFTPGNTSSPYSPNVKKNRRIRVTADPVAGTVRHRFTGYIDEWPVQWPHGTDQSCQVTITATSRMARLAAGMELRSIIEEEYLLDDPVAYYPLGESFTPPAPGRAGDVSGHQQPDLVAVLDGTPIEWGGATGPGTDGLSAPMFNAGRYLLATDGSYVQPGDACFTLEAFVTNDGGTLQTAASVMWGDRFTFIGVYADGKAWASSGVTFLPVDYSIRSGAVINDGEVHHLRVVEVIAAGSITAELYLDGVSVATSSPWSPPSGHLGDRRRLSVGANATPGDAVGFHWDGSISHVAVFSGPTTASVPQLSHAEAGLTGFEGDTANSRFNRLAEYAGVTALIAIDTRDGLSLANQLTDGKTVTELMQEVAATEGGVLFDAADGTLTLHGRDYRYNPVVSFTLDASLQEIEASVEAKMDGQFLVNDITASRPEGATVRAVNEDSIANYGIHREQVEILPTDDAEVVGVANWRVNRYGEPDVRISSVAVDLINSPPALVDDLLDAEISDRITLDNLPDQAPSTSYGGIIEGISESIGAESYTITFELSPAAIFDVWKLGTAGRSELDETTTLAY